MNWAIVYEKASGRIELATTQDLTLVLSSYNPDTYAGFVHETPDTESLSLQNRWALGGELRDCYPWEPVASATSIPADGTTELTVSGLPENTQVWVYGPVEGQWTAGGATSLTTDVAGEYTLRFDPFPFAVREITFHAT